MASKKAGRLAGLAALAGLAYMNKDKLFGAKGETKAAETKADTKEPTASKAEPKESAVDTGDFMSRRLNRVDTDDGKAYSTNNLSPMSSPKVARSEKAPSASVAKAPASSTAMPEGAFRGRRSDIVGGGRSGGRGGPEAGEGSESKPAGAYRGMRSDPEPVGAYRSIRSNPEPEGAYRGTRSDMKKGGAVKKMASGGMTSSASKRADGIASKGKTRGRMC